MKILRSDMPASSTTAPAPAPTATTNPPVQKAAPPRQSSRSRSPPPSPPRALPLRSISRLPSRVARLLVMRDDGADVEFEVGGKVFAAHKLVLAARSPVFRVELFGAEEATGYVRICDMHPDTFEALLHYVYTDSLPPPAVLTMTGGGGARREEQAAAAAAVLAQDLLRAADRYGLQGLKSLTESELCRRHHVVVGADTVLPILALAERHHCWKLKNKCIEFFASRTNPRAVMATDDVEHLVRSCPSVVKELVKIVEAKDKVVAARRCRRPLKMDSAEAFLGFILAFVLGMWTLMYWGYLEQK